jgi:hypothetical protein
MSRFDHLTNGVVGSRVTITENVIEHSRDKAERVPTLGEKLGLTRHISSLLRKARKLGLDAAGLEMLAIQRGCTYYHDQSPLPAATVTREVLSDAELGIALLHPGLRYHPQTIRLGAAMLSSPLNTPEEVSRLAIMERAEIPVRYVAEAGAKLEPLNLFWPRLLELLPRTPEPKSGVMPHPTRFVAMTGITRRGVERVIQWIRPPAEFPADG